jgi:hypothetical protein
MMHKAESYSGGIALDEIIIEEMIVKAWTSTNNRAQKVNYLDGNEHIYRY